jgi:hypothetical protein
MGSARSRGRTLELVATGATTSTIPRHAVATSSSNGAAQEPKSATALFGVEAERGTHLHQRNQRVVAIAHEGGGYYPLQARTGEGSGSASVNRLARPSTPSTPSTRSNRPIKDARECLEDPSRCDASQVVQPGDGWKATEC